MKLFIFNTRIGFLETRRQVCALRLALMIRDDSFGLMRSICFGHKKTPQGGVLVIMPMASWLI